jgi:hypothetical protein
MFPGRVLCDVMASLRRDIMPGAAGPKAHARRPTAPCSPRSGASIWPIAGAMAGRGCMWPCAAWGNTASRGRGERLMRHHGSKHAAKVSMRRRLQARCLRPNNYAKLDDLLGEAGLFKQLKKALIERALAAGRWLGGLKAKPSFGRPPKLNAPAMQWIYDTVTQRIRCSCNCRLHCGRTTGWRL